MATRVTDVDRVRAQGRAAVLRQLGREIRGLRRAPWGNPVGYLFVLPGVLLYFVFSAYPIARGFIMAFQDYRFLIPESRSPFKSFNGLQNFVEMAHDHTFWSSLWVAVKFTIGSFPTNLVVALACAVLLASIRNNRMAVTSRVITYLPVILPISVAMLAWQQMFDPQAGYLSYAFQLIFRRKAPIWLGWGWALKSTVLAAVWKDFGYNTLLFLVGMYGINRELYEAASVDGANAWHRFLRITLPSLKPIFTLVFVLNAGIMSATEEMLILTDGGPGEETLTTGLYLYRIAFRLGDMRMGYAAAMSLVLGLVHTILAFIVFKTMGTERA